MLVDDAPARAALLEQSLSDCGYQVICRLDSARGLLYQVEQHRPDVVIVDLESPERDVLEDMSLLNHHHPTAVVMFAAGAQRTDIERAVRAGVSAYVVDGLDPQRVSPILEVAIARFREYQALRRELQETRDQLADRNLVERAKKLLINQRQWDEKTAYHAMRKLAMDRGQRLADVARDIIAVLELTHDDP